MIIQRLVSLMQLKVDPKTKKETDAALANVKGKLAAIAAVAAPAVLLRAGTEQLKQATATADAAAKGARSVGLTTEAYQELGHAAALSGVQQEQLNAAITRNTAAVQKAARGDKGLAAIYRRAGVNVRTLAKLKPDEQFERIADAIAKVDDPAKRSALSVELFGESGGKLASLLAGGAKGIQDLRKEARDLGLVIPDDQAQAAERFNDQLDRLSGIVAGVKRAFLLSLLPALEPLLVDLVKWRKEDAADINADIKGLSRSMSDFILSVRGGLRDMREMVKLLGGFGNTVKLLGIILGAFIAARYLIQFANGAKLLTAANLRLAASTVAAAAPYVLLAAALAGILLLVLDFVEYTQGGKDSLFEEIFGPATPELLADIKLGMIGVLGILGVIALLIGSVPVAIAAIIGLVAALALSWDDVVDALSDALLEMWRDFSSWFKELKTNFLRFADDVGATLDAWWTDLIRGFLKEFNSVFSKVQAAAARVGVELDNPFKAAEALLGSRGDAAALDAEGRVINAMMQRPQQNNTFDVTVNADGLNQQQAAAAVRDGMEAAMLRKANRAFVAGPGGT